MIGSTAGVQIWMATTPVDMRQGFDRLAARVREQLGHNPLGGHLFVFRNRSAERVKILWWDGSGLVLYYKRLERGTFRFPSTSEAALTIDSTQLLQLLSGSEVVARRTS
jgi:transposase